MQILFLGMPGIYAPPHLAALLEAGMNVVAVGVPAPPGAAPVARLPPLSPQPARPNLLESPSSPGLLQLATAAKRPVFALRRMQQPTVQTALSELDLDLVCVACWPWRIPPALLALPRLGWLNSHPSRLPELRGPAPLIAALQHNMRVTGVSIHWMDTNFDTGDLALQAELGLPEGINVDQAEALAAELGARLMVEVVKRLQEGNLPRIPQTEG